MKLFLKYFLLIYFSIAYLAVYFLVDFSILKSDTSVYSYVPQGAHQVVEINSKEFVKKSIFQFFYNKSYVLPYLNGEDNTKVNVPNDVEVDNIGIDILSKVVFFSEKWQGETLWYGVFSVNDKKDFSKFANNEKQIIEFELVKEFAVCLLTETEQIESVSYHLKQISNQSVKSIDSKIDLSEFFDSSNELNYYVSSDDNSYITDGLLNVSFQSERISFAGEYATVSALTPLSRISENVDTTSAFSLRTTMNFLTEAIRYKELKMDYVGTDIITANAIVPMHVYPNLNVFVSGNDEVYWSGLLGDVNNQDGFTVDYSKSKINYFNQLYFSLGYKMIDDKLLLTNDTVYKSSDDVSFDSNMLLELNVNPDYFSQNLNFEEDKLNPPTMMSNLKVSVFQNIFNDMSSLNKIDHMYCSLEQSNDETKLLLNGEIVFKEKFGHSIIETGVMLIDALNSLESIASFE